MFAVTAQKASELTADLKGIHYVVIALIVIFLVFAVVKQLAKTTLALVVIAGLGFAFLYGRTHGWLG